MKRFVSESVSWMMVIAALAACGKEEAKNDNRSSDRTAVGNPGTVAVSAPAPIEEPTSEPVVVARAVEGNWLIIDQAQPLFTMKGIMSIEADKVSMRLSCSHQGQSVESFVSSGAEISEAKIKTLESKSDPKSLQVAGGNLNCTASLDAGELAYALEDANTLKLTDPNGGSLTVKRVQ